MLNQHGYLNNRALKKINQVVHYLWVNRNLD